MKLMVTSDAHIYHAPNGTFWCEAIYGYSFWKRYMDVFDNIRIVARVKEVKEIENNWLRVDGENIEVYGIPFYQGPVQLIKKYVKIQKVLKSVYEGCDAVLFRLPSPTGQLVLNKKKSNIPVSVEVVYDLTDDVKNFNEGIISYLIAKIQILQLKKACLSANGVSYVTKKAIQRNFPSNASVYGEDYNYFETYYSTITLDDDAFEMPKNFSGKKQFTFIHTDVAMNSERKGEKVVLEAIHSLRIEGWDIKGIFIGDGTMKTEFESYSKKLGIKQHVLFTGLLSSSSEVREYLKQADVFVFPSLAEGLPRGVIEAMAVGLPCVASPVGGIPELLSAEYLADPLNASAFVDILRNLLSDTDKMNQISFNNIQVASDFKNEILQMRRNDFYRKIYRLCNRKES